MISRAENLTERTALTEHEPTQEQFRHKLHTLSSVYNGSQKKGGNDIGCHVQKKLHGILGLSHYLLSVYYEPDAERVRAKYRMACALRCLEPRLEKDT